MTQQQDQTRRPAIEPVCGEVAFILSLGNLAFHLDGYLNHIVARYDGAYRVFLPRIGWYRGTRESIITAATRDAKLSPAYVPLGMRPQALTGCGG